MGCLVLETFALTIGRQVATHCAKAWLGDRTSRVERDSQLTDLMNVGTVDRFVRRKLVRQLDEIGDRIAERLGPLIELEMRGLPAHEREAALDAVVDALADAELTDSLMLNVNLNPDELVKVVRAQVPNAISRAGLSEQSAVLFELVLQESCACLVGIVLQLPPFQPRAIVELLERLGSVMEGIQLILERLPRATLIAPSGTVHDAEFTNKYLSYISNTLDELELFGVDVRRYQPRTSVTVAYLSLTVSRRFSKKSKGPFENDMRLTADDVGDVERTSRVEFALGDSKRTLLRGLAGSGKTTLLQWVAVTAARGQFSGPLARWNGKIPFIVRLRSYAEGEFPQPSDLVGANAAPIASLEPKNWAIRCFAGEKALLLVDGVDELRTERRSKVKKWLSGFLAAFPDADVVVTSRPGAAEPQWLSELNFNPLFLESMTPADITEFSHRWHAAIREWGKQTGGLPCALDELDDYETSLLRRFESLRHLRTLATSPLLCAMLCALNLDRRKQLPSDRMKLYESALELLLERRDAERDVPAASLLKLNATVKISILQHLAWWLTLCVRSEASTQEAEYQIASALRRIPDIDEVDPHVVLKYLLERSGVIREPVSGRIDFVHRTFQEFLAGKYAAEEHYSDVLVRNAHLDQWRETVVMCVGHASVPIRAATIGGLLDRAEAEPRNARKLRMLAGAALETSRVLDQATTRRVEEGLSKIIPPKRAVEARSLARVGDRVLRHLPSNLTDLSVAAAVACVRTAVFIGGDSAIDLLRQYSEDNRAEVQVELTEGWNYYPAERYATEVLADSHLLNGRVHVTKIAQVLCLKYLKHLREASVFIQSLPASGGFSFLADAPSVSDVIANVYSPLDLSPLKEHVGLKQIRLGGRAELHHIEVLSSIPNLEGLGLTSLTRSEFALVARCAGLRELRIYDDPMDIDDLQCFRNHKVPLDISFDSVNSMVSEVRIGDNVRVVVPRARRPASRK